ncbi:MAG: nuclear transport factor 2 family protein [Eudoraea sp.]|nr:nuclear transport factor 2 family protein [Eudoraea sp.]
MRGLIILILMLSAAALSAQRTAEEAVQETIETFFRGFHSQDSILMTSTVGIDPILQTIGNNKAGEVNLRSQDFNQLIQAIVAIPDSVNFHENIKSYRIQVDGAMANAWTPYEFWINDEFSHCGVNSFQLFNDGAGWKIIYLIDTRRKNGCE